MSAEELTAEVAAKKAELAELQSHNKQVEKELQEKKKALMAEKSEMMEGVQARMELIDMLRRDITRMAYDESIRIAQQEYDHPSSLPKK